MREELFPRFGWHTAAALILLTPLVQGGAPRLPIMITECAVLGTVVLWGYEWGWKGQFQSVRFALLDILLVIFLFWALFSLLFAPYHHSAEKALLYLSCCILLYWWLVLHPSLKGLSRALAVISAQGIFLASVAWYQWFHAGVSRPAATFYNPNFLAGFLAVAIILKVGGILFPPPAGRRPAHVAWSAAAAIFMTGALSLTGSRGGMLALFVGLLVAFGGRSILLSLAGVGGSFLALFAVPNPWTERLGDLTRIDVYAYSRISIWKSALSMMLDHPLSGVGLGQFKYFSTRYAFPVEAHWARYGKVAEVAHSEYLQAGAELGLPGLVIVLAVISVAAVSLFLAARQVSEAEKGSTIPLAAALAALLVHAAVDFPLHLPPLALILVVLAAGLRVRGVQSPSWIQEFRFRKVYGLGVIAAAAFAALLAVRPVAGFWYFLGGLGAPQNLLREKWSLEEAPREKIDDRESTRLLERAVAVDPRNASYHNVLGSRYFQAHAAEGDEHLRRKGLFHANFAAQLNPNNYRYALSLGQAMESLYRIAGSGELLSRAAEHYRVARTLAPRLYTLHEKLALLEEEMGDLVAAEESFREVVRLEPSYLRGWYNLGIFLARQGRREEAVEAIEAGRNAAREGRDRPVLSPYEGALVDFDVRLFDNKLRAIENMQTGMKQQ